MNNLLVRIVLGAISFVIFGLPLGGQPWQRYYLCESSSIPISLPAGVPDGTVTPVFFASTRLKSSSAGMTFHNYLKHKILALEFLVEYFNREGHPLTRVPYIALNANEKFSSELRSEVNENLKKGLPPGKAVYIIGESFTLVNECPAKANLTFLHVLFDDAETVQWKMNEWQTEPLIRQIPMTVNFPCDSEHLTSNQYLRASISSDGRVSNIQPIAPPHWACLDNLRKTLESWSFYPALQSGNPSDSELDILVRFYREDQRKKENYGWVSREEIRRPTVVVDFVQVTAKPAEWVVFYGPQAFGITKEPPGGNVGRSPGRKP